MPKLRKPQIADNGQMEEAFYKLLSYVYFDRQNLHLRYQVARFMEEHKDLPKHLSELELQIQNRDTKIITKINQIDLSYIPKSVEKNSTQLASELFSPNFYTNQLYLEPASVSKVSVFINAPVEVHLISVLWLLKYGHILDNSLLKSCVGNRLIIDKTKKITKGRALFRKYEKQYQKWWYDGVKAAKELFAKKEDVTIVNFDFKDFFHTIEFDFTKLEDFLKPQFPDIKKDSLHYLFVEIHKAYRGKFSAIGYRSFNSESDGFSLPIGLLSSYVLANWYLLDFDKHLIEDVNPIYYGRYVDDLMVVVKNTVIKEFTKEHVKENNLEEDKNAAAEYYLEKYFKQVFVRKKLQTETFYRVKYKPYENIQLQPEKLFIYQFNAELSPNLLDRFEEDQKQRISAFMFLSEEEDENFKELDKITFEDNFDSSDVNKAKFKDLEENKFKLSVYLSKIIRGSLVVGKVYDDEEAEKVKKYFKGYFLIRNYYFWEKLFTLWLIRGEYDYLFALYEEIYSQIEKLGLKDKDIPVFSEVRNAKLESRVKNWLRDYLNYALQLAVDLYPDVFKNKNLLPGTIEIINRIDKRSVFRLNGLVRKSYVYYSLMQFSEQARENGFALFDKNSLNKFFERKWSLDFDAAKLFIPYRIKFFEVALQKYNATILSFNRRYDTNKRLIREDFLDTEKILGSAFKLFYEINAVEQFDKSEENKKTVKDTYFKLGKNHAEESTNAKNLSSLCLKIPNSHSLKGGKFRICIVNKYVDKEDFENSLDGKPNDGNERYEEFNHVWDRIKKVPKSDLMIFPEVALPHRFIGHYVGQAVHNQVAFISGVEHWRVGNAGFNFLITCLPIEVHGDKDAIPILRLKNHYAPEEEKWIKEKRLVVPKPEPYRYELFEWRNVYFTSYYCYELADIKHRHLFHGMTDVIFSPVWNKDIHYYNSMVESASRDMHTVIVLSNTSQYGDSRVTIPADHIHRDKVRVKGGTVDDYKVNILVCDLKIEKLRYFQIHDFSEADQFNKDNKTHYKPLPPDYPFDLAELRHRQKLLDE